jgi:hypothetical protein
MVMLRGTLLGMVPVYQLLERKKEHESKRHPRVRAAAWPQASLDFGQHVEERAANQ